MPKDALSYIKDPITGRIVTGAPVRQRFEKFVMPEPMSGCWLWTGAVTELGYGKISVGRKGRPEKAHRVSWVLHRGPIPDGMCVCHRCDNPPCVNPDHLFLGSQSDNLRDMSRKGRNPMQRRPMRGEEQGMAKLTEGRVKAIRAFLGAGEGARTLAALFGVSRAAIRHVAAGRAWRHVS